MTDWTPAPVELDRILWLDCESTGPDPSTDRIVELALIWRGTPDVTRFKPGFPIPDEASAIHGIRNEDVADCPMFHDRASGVWQQLHDAPALGGYNLKRFDLPLLATELERAGLTAPDFTTKPIIDLYQVDMHLRPRTLTAVVAEYLGKDHAGAHTALADAEVLPGVLASMCSRHDTLPRTATDLAALCNEIAPYQTPVDEWFDRSGAEPVFRRGKFAGKTLAFARTADRSYLSWMQRAEGIHHAVKEFVS